MAAKKKQIEKYSACTQLRLGSGRLTIIGDGDLDQGGRHGASVLVNSHHGEEISGIGCQVCQLDGGLCHIHLKLGQSFSLATRQIRNPEEVS